MKQMIKFEVKRMLRNPGFYIAMMIGLLISVVHWIVWVLPAARGMDKYMSLDFALLYPPNLYNSWICEGNNMYSYLYLLILPILVTLPYAATFFSDVNDHLIEFICTRADKREYFYAKFTAVFLSGGIVSCVPLIFNILLCMAVVPTIKPQAADSTSNMVPKGSFSALLFTHPAVYIVISLVVIFLFSGALAAFALNVAFYSNHIFTVLLAPLVLNVFLSALFQLLNLQSWEPSNFINPAYSSPRMIPFVAETAVLLIITGWEFIYRGRQEDIC